MLSSTVGQGVRNHIVLGEIWLEGSWIITAIFFIGLVQALCRCCPITLEHSVVINYILWLSIIRHTLFKQRHPTHSTFQSSVFSALEKFPGNRLPGAQNKLLNLIFYLWSELKNWIECESDIERKADRGKHKETLREIWKTCLPPVDWHRLLRLPFWRGSQSKETQPETEWETGKDRDIPEDCIL